MKTNGDFLKFWSTAVHIATTSTHESDQSVAAADGGGEASSLANTLKTENSSYMKR
eukprot:m.172158 g.172158  ORF g.172158 m.172158 type:complete len:56 (+) comp39080_c0_seq1:2-169(+)